MSLVTLFFLRWHVGTFIPILMHKWLLMHSNRMQLQPSWSYFHGLCKINEHSIYVDTVLQHWGVKKLNLVQRKERQKWGEGKGVETSNNLDPCETSKTIMISMCVCKCVSVYSLLLKWWIKITQKVCVCICVSLNWTDRLCALSFCVYVLCACSCYWQLFKQQ